MTQGLPLGPGGSAAPDDTRAFGVKVSYNCKLNTTLVERRGAHSWLWLEYNAWNDKLFSGSEWIAANTPDCCTQLRQEYKYDFWLQAQLSLRCFLQLRFLQRRTQYKGIVCAFQSLTFFLFGYSSDFLFYFGVKSVKVNVLVIGEEKVATITRCFLNITRIFITPFQDILDAR